MLDHSSPPTVTQGSLRTHDGEALPLLQTNVVSRIDGPLANVVVTQTFKNSRSVPIEAIYSFPLPHDASVWRMEFRIAGRVVKGVIKEKAEARRAYQQAKAEGRTATLLEEDAPAVFTLSVANVAAGAEIIVHLEYQEIVHYEDGRFVFTFPMVAPELYRDGPAPKITDVIPPPRLLSPDRKADVTLEVHLPSDATEIHGRSHTVHPEVGAKGTLVKLGHGGPIANRDFVLEWEVARGGVRPVMRLEPPQAPDGRGTFLLTLAPSRADAKAELPNMGGEGRPLRCGNCGAMIDDARAIVEIAGFGSLVKCRHCGAMLAPATSPVIRATRSRDIAIVFDRSASMRAAMPQARELVMAVVESLLPGDTIMAMTFDHDSAIIDDDLRWLASGPEISRKVAAFLEVPARGGSDVTKALEHIAKMPVREGRTRSVVLVTDGAVGNTAKLIRRVPEILGKSTRLHVLGIGAAVNRYFLESLARAGSGACTIALAADNPRLVRDRFARKVIDGGPVLTDITLSWEGANPTFIHPSPLPELYGNEPLHLVGRYTGVGPSKLVITATTPSGTPFRQEIDVMRPEPATPNREEPRLERVWARREVTKLIEAQRNAEALALALEHSLASPLTSLIAEDTEVSVQNLQIPKAQLRVTRGMETGRVFKLDTGTTRIGRAASANIVLSDGNISRIHCEITVNSSGYRLQDHSSTNGTRVNGVQMRESRLERDAVIELGGASLTLEFIENETIAILPTETVNVADDEPEEEIRSLARDHSPVRENAARVMSFDMDDDAVYARAPARPAAGAPARGGAPPMPGGMAGVRPMTMPLNAMSPPRAPAPAPARGMPNPPAVSLKAPTHPPGAPLPRPQAAAAAPMSPPPMMGSMPMSPPPPSPGLRGAPPPRAPSHDYEISSSVADTPPPGSMRAVAAARRSSSARPMSGDLREVPLEDLLMLFKTSKKSGTLELSARKGSHGRIHLRRGFIAGVEIIGRDVPRQLALNEMIRWDGLFELAPPEEDREFHPDDFMDVDGVVMTALKAVDAHDAAAHGSIPQAPALLASGPAYPEAELTFVKHRVKGELDLVLLVDATASMGPYIKTVQQHMNELLDAVAASPLCKNLRIAIVSYRDHPPQESSYASRVNLRFTDNVAAAIAEVHELAPVGGGDGPESVTDGLHAVVRLDWRPDAAKAIVWFGDAPPHGVGERGDGFPNGCPCGNDWYAQAESCREMGIAIYAMGCLPAIRGYQNAEHVFRTVARATHGMYLALHEAELLVPLIAGAAESTLDDQRIDEHVVDLVNLHREELAATDEPERTRWILQGLHHRKVERRALGDDGMRTFRHIVLADVDASLGRLRAQARVAW